MHRQRPLLGNTNFPDSLKAARRLEQDITVSKVGPEPLLLAPHSGRFLQFVDKVTLRLRNTKFSLLEPQTNNQKQKTKNQNFARHQQFHGIAS